MKRLCGFRPTGRLHLGHYLAVIRPGQEGATVLVANYHAPREQAGQAEVLRRFGVVDVVEQRATFDAEMYFRLLSIASMGDLERMTQYKAAATGDRTAQTATYPVLMAMDVAGYDEVLVGEDQVQHLEYARRLLRKYNRVFQENVGIPKAVVVAGRVMDLRDPAKKMSKSSPEGCLFLDDDAATIRRKVRKAVTTPDGVANLRFLFERFVGGEVPATNEELKSRLADALVAVVTAS